MRKPLRKSGAPWHIGRISGGICRPGDRTVKQSTGPGTTHLLPKKEKERERPAKRAGAQAQQGACPVMPLRPTHGVALPFPCRFSLSLFLCCVGACLTIEKAFPKATVELEASLSTEAVAGSRVSRAEGVSRSRVEEL